MTCPKESAFPSWHTNCIHHRGPKEIDATGINHSKVGSRCYLSSRGRSEASLGSGITPRLRRRVVQRHPSHPRLGRSLIYQPRGIRPLSFPAKATSGFYKPLFLHHRATRRITMTTAIETSALPGVDDEAALVTAARAGDTSCFEALMRRYERRIYRQATTIARNESDAEEVAQEAFLKAFDHIEK